MNSDDAIDLFADDFTVDTSNECFIYDNVDDINLFDSIARLRSRGICANSAAPSLSSYTDIYDSNGILNQLSSPLDPDTQQDQETNIPNLRRQFDLSVDPITNTNAGNDDGSCFKEIYGDFQTLVCDMGRLKRNILKIARVRHFTVYDVQLSEFNPSSFSENLIDEIHIHS